LIELDYPTHQQIAAPDLSIAMAVSPNPPVTGPNLTYTITVTNSRPGAATNVVVADVLPASLTFVSCSTSAGSCGGTGNNRTVNLGSVSGAPKKRLRLSLV